MRSLFITLTLAERGDPTIYVNAEHVAAITTSDAVRVVLVNGGAQFVKESVEEVLKKLDEALDSRYPR